MINETVFSSIGYDDLPVPSEVGGTNPPIPIAFSFAFGTKGVLSGRIFSRFCGT
jgi:hypothetical protein